MADHNKVDDFRPSESNVAYIGEGVTVKGEISVPDIIVVDGTVEGDLTARSIRVGPSGIIKGNIVSTDADVHGSISEKLEVKQLLIVRATGRIDGNISYGEVQIEKGAVISGAFASTDFRSDKKTAKVDQNQGKLERLKITHNADPNRSHNGQVTRPNVPAGDLKASG
ncbi:MAG: polymer-forming cytoskeletal protein [Hyphomicrobiales bacterium]